MTRLRVANDFDRLVQLLKVLLFLLSQLFTPSRERFIHPLRAGETNDGARDTLIDPRQRDMAHLPVMFLRDLFNTPNDLLIKLRVTGALVTGLLLALRASG
jgi:hypothetical protein